MSPVRPPGIAGQRLVPARARQIGPVWFALAIAVGSAVLACVSAARLERVALPDASLVFLHRTPDQASRRAEILKRQREGRKRPRLGELKARVGDLADYIGLGSTEVEKRAEAQGQLSLLDPRSQEIAPQPFAVRGARPLDLSSDGNRLLYVTPRHGGPQIMEYDRELGNLRAITRGPFIHATGCYGPGDRVAYSEVQRGPAGFVSRIVVSETRTGAARTLTPGPRDSSPAWSPDGKVLLYVIEADDESARIASLDPDRDDPPRLIARGRSPAFSPDGEWVVYSASTRDGWRLWRMRPDGSGKLSLGTGTIDEHWPSVSPDGRFVAYVAEGNYRQQLRVRRFDGSGDRPLLEHGDGAHPVWN